MASDGAPDSPADLFGRGGIGIANPRGASCDARPSRRAPSPPFVVGVERAPPGYGAPTDVHSADDEFFHILEGELSVAGPGRERTAVVVESVKPPRDVPHGFRKIADQPARMLVVLSPPAYGRPRCFAISTTPGERGRSRPKRSWRSLDSSASGSCDLDARAPATPVGIEARTADLVAPRRRSRDPASIRNARSGRNPCSAPPRRDGIFPTLYASGQTSRPRLSEPGIGRSGAACRPVTS
ncbi:cupin domain [Roseiarcus fermentans]|uniref:Cupin domain n=1 Tax=Roseiarcus fermentans TaxID=1473586 RepID=A0A366FR19_9HYPH|nr:cupin domain [Roseiarcus fermentans]